jgi:NADPH:quinone reductase-like Zn-dependent oxidoreductase
MRNLRRLVELHAARTIDPVITERVSLNEVPAAMTRLLQRKVQGKVVVLPEA